MRFDNRYILITCFSLLILSVYFGFNNKSNAQSLDGFISDGVAYESIVIGKSNQGDVIAAYGDKFRLVNHQGYSYEMIYKNLGLGFYYCQADPKKEIFVIEIEAPSRAMSQKGVVVGQSTFADVFRLYGKPGEDASGFEYKGIAFYYEVDREDEGSDEKPEQIGKVIKGSGHNPIKIDKITTDIKEASASESIFDCIRVSSKREVKASHSASENTLVIDEVDEIGDLRQKEIDDEEEKVLRKRVVKQIDLIEKTGTRQCHVNPQGKK